MTDTSERQFRRGIVACRLWRRPASRGRPDFLSGVLGGTRVLIVTNEEPRDDHDAEFLMLFLPRLERKAELPQPKTEPDA